MFKRSIARLLIALQVYSGLYNGLHADITTAYAFEDSVHIQAFPCDRGLVSGFSDRQLFLQFGTQSNSNSADSSVIQLIDEFSVPFKENKQSFQSSQKKIATAKAAVSPARISSLSPVFEEEDGDEEQWEAALDGFEGGIDSSAVSDGELFEDDTVSCDASVESSLLEEEIFELDGPIDIALRERGMWRTSEGIETTINGLRLVITDDGDMILSGKTTHSSKKLVFHTSRTFTLAGVEADQLEIHSPFIFNTGNSSIDYLSMIGLPCSAKENSAPRFVNGGSLTAREAFLDGLNIENEENLDLEAVSVRGCLSVLNRGHWKSAALKGFIHKIENYGGLQWEDAATLEVTTLQNASKAFIDTFQTQGDIDNTGTFVSNYLIVKDGGRIRIGGAATIDHLILEGDASSVIAEEAIFRAAHLYLEDTSTFTNFSNRSDDPVHFGSFVGVLHGQGTSGSIINNGSFYVGKTEQTIRLLSNRGKMIVGAEYFLAEKFENRGAFSSQGSLLVSSGMNTGVLKALTIEAQSIFTNERSGGLDILSMTGKGEFENHGVVETQTQLDIAIRKMTNAGRIKVKKLIGYATLETFVNQEESSCEAEEEMIFTPSTQVSNEGILKAKTMHLVGDKTVQKGTLAAKSLDVSGGDEFENLGEMDVTDTLSLDSARFVNRGSVEATTLTCSEALTYLGNREGASITLKGGAFKTHERTELINGGSITGGAYEFFGNVIQEGTLNGTSLILSGDYEFENFGDMDISGPVALNTLRFINRKSLIADSITGSMALTHFENAQDSSITLQGGLFKTQYKTKIVNYGSITDGHYDFSGRFLDQHGILKGKSLTTDADAEILTYDTQEIDIEGPIETSFGGVLRGKVRASKFSNLSILEIFGIVVTDDFAGSGIIHPSGFLDTKVAAFRDEMTIYGTLVTDRLAASRKLFINGLVKVQDLAVLSGDLDVGTDGKFLGCKDQELDVYVDGTAEIAGVMDVDRLTAARAVTVTQNGILETQESTVLSDGLTVTKDATAQLKGLRTDGGTITNQGKFISIGVQEGRAEFNLINEGQAGIDCLQPMAMSVLGAMPGTGDILKLRVHNKPTGTLTLKDGKFDLTGAEAFVNEGTLNQDQSQLQWTPRLGQSAINTGKWNVSQALTTHLIDYAGEAMGELNLAMDLAVRTQGDGVDVLQGLSQLKATKVEVRAPQAIIRNDRVFCWPLVLTLDGICQVNAELKAPGIKVGADTYTSTGGNYGSLITTNGPLEVRVNHFNNPNGKLFGKASTFVRAESTFRNGERRNKPAPAQGAFLYERNESAILSEEGDLTLESAVADILNYYGEINSIKGKVNVDTSGDFVTTAGFVHSKTGGDIKAKKIRVIRDETSSYLVKGCPGHSWRKKHTFHGDSTGTNWCGGLGCNPRSVPFETSDQSMIWAESGEFSLTYQFLEILASQIVSGEDVNVHHQPIWGTPGSRGKIIAKFDASSRAPDVQGTDIKPRHAPWAGIKANHDLRGEMGDANISGMLESGGSIALKAIRMTLESLGSTDRRAFKGMAIRLIEGMRKTAETNRLLTLTAEGAVDSTLPLGGQYNQVAVMGCALPAGASPAATYAGLYLHTLPMLPSFLKCMGHLGFNPDDLLRNGFDFMQRQSDTITTRKMLTTHEEVNYAGSSMTTFDDMIASSLPMIVMEISKNYDQTKSLARVLSHQQEVERAILEPVLIIPSQEAAPFSVGMLAHDGSIEVDVEGDAKLATGVLGSSGRQSFADRVGMQSNKSNVSLLASSISSTGLLWSARQGKVEREARAGNITSASAITTHQTITESGKRRKKTRTEHWHNVLLADVVEAREVIESAHDGQVTTVGTQYKVGDSITFEAKRRELRAGWLESRNSSTTTKKGSFGRGSRHVSGSSSSVPVPTSIMPLEAGDTPDVIFDGGVAGVTHTHEALLIGQAGTVTNESAGITNITAPKAVSNAWESMSRKGIFGKSAAGVQTQARIPQQGLIRAEHFIEAAVAEDPNAKSIHESLNIDVSQGIVYQRKVEERMAVAEVTQTSYAKGSGFGAKKAASPLAGMRASTSSSVQSQLPGAKTGQVLGQVAAGARLAGDTIGLARELYTGQWLNAALRIGAHVVPGLSLETTSQKTESTMTQSVMGMVRAPSFIVDAPQYDIGAHHAHRTASITADIVTGSGGVAKTTQKMEMKQKSGGLNIARVAMAAVGALATGGTSLLGNVAQASNISEMVSVSVSGESSSSVKESRVPVSFVVTDDLTVNVRDMNLTDVLLKARRISGHVDTLRSTSGISRKSSTGRAYTASSSFSVGKGGVDTLDESIDSPSGVIAEDASAFTVGKAVMTDASMSLPGATFNESVEYHRQQLQHRKSVHGFYAPIGEGIGAYGAVHGLVQEAKALRDVIQSQAMNEAMEEALDDIVGDEGSAVHSGSGEEVVLGEEGRRPTASAVKRVIKETPELAEALKAQTVAKAMLEEAVRLETLETTKAYLGRDSYVEGLGLDTPSISRPAREEAASLRLGAYRMLETVNNKLNQFARENPELAYYTAKTLEYGAVALHAGVYVTAAATGGPAGIAAVIAMEQMIGASINAAVEISAEHAAASASTPEEAQRLREGVYQVCEKGFAVAAVFGIARGVKAVKGGAGRVAPQKVGFAQGAVPGGKSTAKAIGEAFEKGDMAKRPMLPGEGKVGSFRELDLMGKKGDNLTPNHMPQAAFMKAHGVERADGIAMMTEQPVPGVGGRHRTTRTYGRQPDLSATPRQELARDLVDARNIYRHDGLLPEARPALLKVAEKNRQVFSDLFKKGDE